MAKEAGYHSGREPSKRVSPVGPSRIPAKDNYRSMSPLQREDYKTGMRKGRSLGGRRPYTGIPVHLQEREDLLESRDYTRNDILHDMGVADRLMIEGIRGTGSQFDDAARLYRLALKGAEEIGDYNLRQRVYLRALDRFSWANVQLRKLATPGKKGDLRASFGVSPIVKLSRLEESLGFLGGRQTRGERLERYAAVAFFGFSLIFLAAIYSKTLGAVAGTNSQDLFGLIAFILWIVGFYFFFRKKRY